MLSFTATERAEPSCCSKSKALYGHMALQNEWLTDMGRFTTDAEPGLPNSKRYQHRQYRNHFTFQFLSIWFLLGREWPRAILLIPVLKCLPCRDPERNFYWHGRFLCLCSALEHADLSKASSVPVSSCFPGLMNTVSSTQQASVLSWGVSALSRSLWTLFWQRVREPWGKTLNVFHCPFQDKHTLYTSLFW